MRTERCHCDACVEIRSPHAAWTPDGYCAYCSTHCFLPATAGGGASMSRVGLPRDIRLANHAAPAAMGPGGVDPRGLLDTAVSNIKDKGTRRRAQVALSVAEAVTPYVAPKAGKVVKQAIKGLRRLFK